MKLKKLLKMCEGNVQVMIHRTANKSECYKYWVNSQVKITDLESEVDRFWISDDMLHVRVLPYDTKKSAIERELYDELSTALVENERLRNIGKENDMEIRRLDQALSQAHVNNDDLVMRIKDLNAKLEEMQNEKSNCRGGSVIAKTEEREKFKEMLNDNPNLSCEEACKVLGISTATFRRWKESALKKGK